VFSQPLKRGKKASFCELRFLRMKKAKRSKQNEENKIFATTVLCIICRFVAPCRHQVPAGAVGQRPRYQWLE
jgi:hypothetical protein